MATQHAKNFISLLSVKMTQCNLFVVREGCNLVILAGSRPGAFFASFRFRSDYALANRIRDKILRRICIPLILFLFIAHTIIDETCFFVMKSHLTPELWGTIFATNFHETIEFTQTYLPPLSLLIIVLSLVSFFTLYFIVEYKKIGKQKSVLAKTIVFLFLLVITSIECCRPDIFINYLIPEFKYFEGKLPLDEVLKQFQEQMVSLEQYNQKTNIQQTSDCMPNKVVIILGESFSKKHSQLYNYDKQTSPKLKSLQNDSLLAVFNNVQSSYTTTNSSFQTILNSHNSEMPYKWYKSKSLIHILKDMGYHTTWLTVQGRSYVNNGIQNKYASQNDTVIRSPNTQTNDTWLLNQITHIDINDRKATFFHLWGQHTPYKTRYSLNFEVFKNHDYLDFPINQRQIRAEYDNATLYNDFIVYELMTAHQNADAIVFYFPDHGEDIFETDPTYAGHARSGIKESIMVAKQIPFMVYISPTYKQKHPDETKKIFSSVNNNFVTDNFTYAVMDILGYKFADNDFVQKYSLFNK